MVYTLEESTYLLFIVAQQKLKHLALSHPQPEKHKLHIYVHKMYVYTLYAIVKAHAKFRNAISR